MTIKQELEKIVEAAIGRVKNKEGFEKISLSEILIEEPKEKMRGDYSANAAFLIAKNIGKNPFEIATFLKQEIEKEKSIIEKVEVVNGFLNFFISRNYLKKQLEKILKEKNKFGSLKPVKKEKINVEFISANPTGPLTLGNGRGGFCGDVLANVLEKAGYSVTKEYYINDTGNQIKKLGHSVIGDSEAVYKGEYILKLRDEIKGDDPEKVGEIAAKYILQKMLKPAVKKMGIKFDVWFSEKSLYEKNDVDKAIAQLAKNGFTYESEKAVWFKSKDLEDDKDRVLIRADGIKTYFASDIAYLNNKFKRKFDRLIMFLGADHYGYVPRLRAAATALGFENKKIDAIVMQMVRLFEKGKEVRMSKRAGIYYTLDELIDEVGLDIARFFFLMISPNTHMNFNMDLAKEKSEKNPVFKAQYAYARINSILKKAGTRNPKSKNLNLLSEPSELELMKEMLKLPDIVKDVSIDYQVQRLPQYATDLSDAFHKFYEKCRVISDDKKISEARLCLICASRIVLKNTLDLMGISAPEKM